MYVVLSATLSRSKVCCARLQLRHKSHYFLAIGGIYVPFGENIVAACECNCSLDIIIVYY